MAIFMIGFVVGFFAAGVVVTIWDWWIESSEDSWGG